MYRRYKKAIEDSAQACGASKTETSPMGFTDPSKSKAVSSTTLATSAATTKSTTVAEMATTTTAATTTSTTAVTTTSPTVATDPKTAVKEKVDKSKEKMKAELDDLMKMVNDTENMIRAAMARAPPETNKMRALRGDVTMGCPSASKIVRIFTSSTFTDTRHERNMLMKHAYPRIKAYCKRIGYEFQVVDMRWGVRDEATDDHMGTELCLKELKLCQKVSTGPYFVSLLSHKYGYTNFPRYIPEKDFTAILGGIELEEAKALFNKWYTLDRNALQDSYVLASVSTHIPDFVSDDFDKKKAAKEQWWRESGIMQDALASSVNKVFDRETARTYTMSITETEVQDGLLRSGNQSKYALWLKRDIEDIEQQEHNYALSRYIECLGPEEKWKTSREMLKELKDDRMRKKLQDNQIMSFNVNWCGNGGINPDQDPKHKLYLDSLCEGFVEKMTAMIDTSISEREKTDDPVLEECYQHIRFCQSKCEGFAGRKDTLEEIKAYLKGPSSNMFVLHGGSGSGKTSIMAMAAKSVQGWLGKGHVVVLRFLGTSPDSSFLPSLLRSITNQIRIVYLMKPLVTQLSLETEILAFKHAMMARKSPRPLVLFLDSLDQLDPAYNARKLSWLIHKLAPKTKVVVSTLEEVEYESFPMLKAAAIPDSNFLSVPVLDPSDARTICTNWLTTGQRKLTDHQMNVVLEYFQKCPTPLFLKLSIEEASRWSSFLPDIKAVLQDTVRASIDHLFLRLEKIHGHLLVSRALAYLTLARNGATEAELEDILSCDDDVLNDVYMYWTPPTRRLPPLLLVRIRHDLDQFLVERGADGLRVMYWYHRQFIEAAKARYCSDTENNKRIHSNLADFFNGTWANGTKKEFTTKKGEKGAEDRYVTQQPLKYGDSGYNIRALNNLPYHRRLAGELDLLKKECLANTNFILHKLEALPQVSLLENYKLAIEMFPDDELISSIYAALCLSQKAISQDPRQVMSQLIGRMNDNNINSDFLASCRQFPLLRLVPSTSILTRPGGQLVSCIAAHKHDIDMMDMSPDGSLVITVCQEDNEVKIWDVKEGKLQRNVMGAKQCTEAHFCHNGEWLVYEADKKCIVETVNSGRRVGIVPCPSSKLAVGGKNQDILCVFHKLACGVFDLSKNCERVAIVLGKRAFGAISLVSATENYVAVSDDSQVFIDVLDLRTNTFISSFRGFPVKLDEDGEEEDSDIEAMAIFPDETHLAYVSMFTGEVVFADFTGNKLRSFVHDEKTYRSLKFSVDGRYFSMRESRSLYIYNTSTLQVEDQLDHPSGIVDERSLDMMTVLTVGEDCNLRLWDRRRPKLEQKTRTSVFDKLQTSDLLLLDNSRYILMALKEKGADHNDIMLVIYDVFNEKFVKQAKIVGYGPESISLIRTNDADKVLVELCRRMYLVDVPSLRVEHTFQGVLADTYFKIKVTTNNQFVTVSRGRRNLKVFDVLTGKIVKVIKMGQKDRIQEVAVNKQGTVAAALTEEGEEFLLVDLQQGIVKRKFESGPEFGEEYLFGNMADFSEDGRLFVFDSEVDIPGLKKSVCSLIVWDMENDCLVSRLIDRERQEKYEKLKSTDDSTSCDSFVFLDNDRVLVTGFDNIMRIFDCRTGTLEKRLEVHTSSVEAAFNPKADYVLSYGALREEDCLWLWSSADNYSKAASFTLDKTINKINWSSDGKFIITTRTTDGLGVTVWTIQMSGQHKDFNKGDYPQNISGEVDCGKLCVPKYVEDEKEPALLPEDEGDPDSDPEEPKDDDDDDDDDDDHDDAGEKDDNDNVKDE